MINECMEKDSTQQNRISECPVCGGRETWTGKTELRDDNVYYEMHCQECGSTGFEWDATWQEPLKPFAHEKPHS